MNIIQDTFQIYYCFNIYMIKLCPECEKIVSQSTKKECKDKNQNLICYHYYIRNVLK